MVITRTVEMHAQLVGYDFKKKGLPTDKNIAVEIVKFPMIISGKQINIRIRMCLEEHWI